MDAAGRLETVRSTLCKPSSPRKRPGQARCGRSRSGCWAVSRSLPGWLPDAFRGACRVPDQGKWRRRNCFGGRGWAAPSWMAVMGGGAFFPSGIGRSALVRVPGPWRRADYEASPPAPLTAHCRHVPPGYDGAVGGDLQVRGIQRVCVGRLRFSGLDDSPGFVCRDDWRPSLGERSPVE